MSDPNRIEWKEHRLFTARYLVSFDLELWGHGRLHFWEVHHPSPRSNGVRSGTVQGGLVEAKRAAEACARAWASELELAGVVT